MPVTTTNIGRKLKSLFSNLSKVISKPNGDGLDDAIKLMQDVHSKNSATNSTAKLTNKLISYICKLYECTRKEFMNARSPEMVEARKLCYFFMHNEFDMRLDDISLMFKKDLSLVSKSISSLVAELDKNIDLKIKFELIKKKLTELTSVEKDNSNK